MGEPGAFPAGATSLRPFLNEHAPEICSWVTTPDDVRRLAPGTEPPLTPAKVLAWRRPGGRSFIWPASAALDASTDFRPMEVNGWESLRTRGDDPAGYAELNLMPGDSAHLWIGHCVIHPALRGMGFGYRFVRELLGVATRDLAARRVSLIVFQENAPAVRCYRRAGFVEVGPERHEFNGVSETLLRMEFSESRPPSQVRSVSR
jgi:RimJ/RimL family protein N-acetyltransferase